MKFKYKCTSKDCVNVEELVVIDKCPCKAFKAEYCEHCGARLDKFSNTKDIQREEELKKQRAERL